MQNHAMPSNTTITSFTPFVNGVDDDDGGHYIEHQVSQFDTLAGVAIKYGVEIADLKRRNGLATDLQMYALKSLQIPSLRRHPPAPSLSNESPSLGENSTRRNPNCRRHSSYTLKLKSSPQQKVSPAMTTFQNYYGLKPPNPNGLLLSEEAKEMEVELFDSPFSGLHKSGLLPNGSLFETDKSVRRRQKLDVDSNDGGSGTPNNGGHSNGGDIFPVINGKGLSLRPKSSSKLVADATELGWFSSIMSDVPLTSDGVIGGGTPENGNNSGGIFTAVTGKSLSLRPKSSSRLAADAESGWLSSTLSALRDPSIISDGVSRVHKSLSTSSLQEQALSAAASIIARPIFDGFSKPISCRKNKAALD